MRILAGDIGGTNVRLVYVQDGDDAPIRHEKTFASADYAGVIEVVEAFLTFFDIQRPLDVACLAVAGPIIDGTASLTNLPWKITEEALADTLQTKSVCLINDLVAASFAIPTLDATVVLDLKPVQCDESKAIKDAVVIGVGTGLGAAHLVWLDSYYRVFSSEAGHVAFAPGNETEGRLLQWMQRQQSHVSIELLLSGRGIYTIYQFLRDEVGVPETSGVSEALHKSDPAQVISEHAIAGDDPLCEQTLSCFIDIYAAVAGDIALHHFPVSAVYLVGGIPPKIAPLLMARQAHFAKQFCNKGLMRENLQQLPVKLVVDDSPGLNGAIAYARHHLMLPH